MRRQKHSRGFSLLELMVSMALGLIVLGSAVQLFNMGIKSTTTVSQRAEMQQNMRAAIEMMTKDISMAGSGLPEGGIQLINGAGYTPSLFGCDQTGVCHLPASFQYPNGNYMTGIIPGFQVGVEQNAVVPSTPGTPSSSITVIYADYSFPLNQYYVTFPGAPAANGTTIGIAPNPAFNPAPPLVTSPGGLKVGDLIWLSNPNGNTVAEVTGFNANSIQFADGDPLRMNQSNVALAHNVRSIQTAAACPPTCTTAYRLMAVTYYLTVPNNGQLPRLMRQVNGLAPVPVADNIINLQFAYDAYNATNSVLDANQVNPIGVGDSLDLIQKVNISVLGQALGGTGNSTQNMALATSVSARNMAFSDRYK
jgi:prepilin-type N-terminal cleavage/methylation domain-containing protein